VVIGAMMIQGLEVVEAGVSLAWPSLLIGAVIAYVSGIVAIKLVLEFVRRGNLRYFAYYCFAAGGAGLWLIQ
jgi:undecaprenyl-diphosphatase